jgi:hypothetical protein
MNIDPVPHFDQCIYLTWFYFTWLSDGLLQSYNYAEALKFLLFYICESSMS